MPARFTFFDMSVSTAPPNGHRQPLPLTLGPNWQPNDVRLFLASGSGSGSASTLMMRMYPDPPATFTSAYSINPGSETHGVYYRRLVSGDVDSSVSWPKPPGWRHFVTATMTARGVSTTVAPVAGNLRVTYVAGETTATVDSVSAPAAGVMIFCLATVARVDSTGWPNWAVPMGVPTGWTHLTATEKSGINFDEYDTSSNAIVVAKVFTGAGSTGTVTVPTGKGGPAFAGAYWFLQAAPDVSSTGGTASSVSTATASSSSSGNNPHSIAGPAVSRSAATPGYNPLYGERIDLEKTLDGSPVKASRVLVDADVPAGAKCEVFTSLNRGASWDVATHGKPVPRLREGDTTTREIWSKVALSRPDTSVPLPVLKSLEIHTSLDKGVDVVVPCGHGVIEKAKVKATGGNSGGGSSSGGGGGVTAKGGGASGGAPNHTIHAADLASLIKLAQWEQPFTIYAGTNRADAVKAMVLDRLPGHKKFNLASTAEVVGSLLVFGADQGGDPWDDIQGVAQAIGYEVFFDSAGTFVFQPIPDPRFGEPVREFDQSIDPVITEVEQELDLSKVYNYIVGKGESTSSKNAFNAFAINDDPNSRTSVQRIGKRVQRLTFQLKTQEECQVAADATLLNSLGLSDTVTLTIPADPSLECGDVIKLYEPATGVSDLYVIQQVAHLPMNPVEGMQLVCFRQTTREGAA